MMKAIVMNTGITEHKGESFYFCEIKNIKYEQVHSI